MLSFEDLVTAIVDLDSSGVISFEKFREMRYLDIKEQYFAMPHYTTIQKAITKIGDIRSGKTGSSEHTIIEEYFVDGELKKTRTKTTYF